MKHLLITIALVVPLGGCAAFDGWGDILEDPTFIEATDAADELFEEGLELKAEVAVLKAELDEAIGIVQMEGLSVEAAENAAAAVSRLAALIASRTERIDAAKASYGEFRGAADEIAAKYDKPEWLTAAVVGGAALLGKIVGMGMPTSGPLAPILGFLGPWLQAIGLRNPEKRKAKRDAAAKASAAKARAKADLAAAKAAMLSAEADTIPLLIDPAQLGKLVEFTDDKEPPPNA